MHTWKIRLPLLILAAGIALVILLMATRSRPEQRPVGEAVQIVEAVRTRAMTVVPRVTTYGEVVPDRIWQAVSQVAGRVVWMADRMKNGNFVRQGADLLRIDPREYRLAISSSEADVEKARAALAELETTQTNLAAQLELHRQSLAYGERELERQQNLHSSRAISASEVEQQQVTVLDQRLSLATLQANYDLLPSQIAYKQAELAAAEASLEQARLNLSYTTLVAPFDGRVDSSAVQIDQYVPAGQTLFQIDSVSQAEITVGISSEQLAMLAGARVEQVVETLGRDERPRPRHRQSYTVLVDGNGHDFVWNARFGRMSASVDPATRMIEMVVVVDNPYARPKPGERITPPLSKGTFCTVIIRGEPQPDRIVVPRRALHEGNLYIADSESRLEIRPASVSYYLDRYAILEGGIAEGETLVTSDIIPAVSGMKLDARVDDNFYREAERDIGPDSAPFLEDGSAGVSDGDAEAKPEPTPPPAPAEEADTDPDREGEADA